MKSKEIDWRRINIVQRVTDVITTSDKRFFIILIAALLFICISLLIASNFESSVWGDVYYYYEHAIDILAGKIPYQDFETAYPPLFLAICIIPAIFTTSPDTYCFIYSLLSAMFIVIGAYFSLKILNEFGIAHKHVYFAFFLLLLCMSIFCVTRNDSITTVFVIIAFYCFLKNKYALSFGLLALGIMTKIYPAIFLIAFVIPFIINKQWLKGTSYLVWTGLICFLIELPILIITPEHAFDYIFQHTSRGIQIEAVISGPLEILKYIFPDLIYDEFSYGSANIVGPMPDAIAPILLPLMAVCLAVFFFYTISKLWNKKINNKNMFIIISLFSAITIFIFLILNKVYSAQYNIWIFMLLPIWFVSMIYMKIDVVKMSALVMIFGIICLFNWINITDAVFITTNIIKAILLIMIAVISIKGFIKWLNQDEYITTEDLT